MEIVVVIFFAFVPFALFLSILAVLNKASTQKSRLPFDYQETTRIPGFSLLVSHRNLTFDMLLYSMLSVAYFQLPFSIPAIATLIGVENKLGSPWAYSIVCLSAAIYALVKSLKAFRRMRNIRLGIEAEWAVANSLAKITDSNVRVFHDIQGPNFNVDHVLTYPGGILAIETKGRRKPNNQDKKDTHKLTVKGEALEFPHYTDKETVAQAMRQAKWLSSELASSTGMVLNVLPMIVIPGWYIQNQQKPLLPVLNDKLLVKFYKSSTKIQFDEAALSRINHQLGLLSRRMDDEF